MPGVKELGYEVSATHLIDLADRIRDESKAFQLDVRRNVEGNQRAGVRSRHNVRNMYRLLEEFMRVSIHYQRALTLAKQDD